MNNKTPEQLQKSYKTAATVFVLIALGFFVASRIISGGWVLTHAALLLAVPALYCSIKASYYGKIAHPVAPTKSAQVASAQSSKDDGKTGAIISGVFLALSILAPFITGLIVGISCNARGATNESSCPEGWSVLFVGLAAIPCAIISGIVLIIFLFKYSSNKKKLESLQQDNTIDKIQ